MSGAGKLNLTSEFCVSEHRYVNEVPEGTTSMSCVLQPANAMEFFNPLSKIKMKLGSLNPW